MNEELSESDILFQSEMEEGRDENGEKVFLIRISARGVTFMVRYTDASRFSFIMNNLAEIMEMFANYQDIEDEAIREFDSGIDDFLSEVLDLTDDEE